MAGSFIPLPFPLVGGEVQRVFPLQSFLFDVAVFPLPAVKALAAVITEEVAMANTRLNGQKEIALWFRSQL